jgi:hypothetical protein
MNFEKLACDLADVLYKYGYITFDESLNEINLYKKDLENAYKVAPRLVNLIKNIVDRY